MGISNWYGLKEVDGLGVSLLRRMTKIAPDGTHRFKLVGNLQKRRDRVPDLSTLFVEIVLKKLVMHLPILYPTFSTAAIPLESLGLGIAPSARMYARAIRPVLVVVDWESVLFPIWYGELQH